MTKDERDEVLDRMTRCDQTIMREDDNSLRHCTRTTGHDRPDWPFAGERLHTDGERAW